VVPPTIPKNFTLRANVARGASKMIKERMVMNKKGWFLWFQSPGSVRGMGEGGGPVVYPQTKCSYDARTARTLMLLM
jgi:hypothetical protein